MTEPDDSKSLIIAGMHRSHTSLVTEGFKNAGLFIGEHLIGASDFNLHGHFESLPVVAFHRNAIKENGLNNWWHLINREKANDFAESEKFKNTATTVLQQHFNKKLYGWKDPRSAFFLNGWHQILDNPYYILVFRHPVSCVHSLNRRSLRNHFLKMRPLLSMRHFNLWDNTNKCLIDFYRKYPDRCQLLHAPDDLLDDSFVNKLNTRIRDEWKLPLGDIDFSAVYDTGLVKSATFPGMLKMIYNTRKETKQIYQSLLTLRLR